MAMFQDGTNDVGNNSIGNTANSAASSNQDTTNKALGDSKSSDTPDTNKSEAPKVGLDLLKEISDNKRSKEQEAAAKAEPKESFSLQDPIVGESINTLASQLKVDDFITDDTRALLSDPEVDQSKALMAMMTDAMRGAYSSAMNHSAQLNSKAIKENSDALTQKARSISKDIVRDSDLMTQIPQMKNPIIADMVKSQVAILRTQDPDISNTEITRHVKASITDMANMFNNDSGTSDKKESENEDDDFDWDEYANS